MKSVFEKSLEKLDKYLNETTDEEIKRKLEKYDRLRFNGPTLEEYYNQFSSAFKFYEPDTLGSIEYSFTSELNNKKPNFSYMQNDLDFNSEDYYIAA
jgi:hypothetical protein